MRAASSSDGMPVLVTGGGGFIGSELVRQLVDSGCIVRILDNFSSGKATYIPSNRSKIVVFKGDVRNPVTVSKAVHGMKVVYHLAALPFIPDSYRQPREFFETNVMGTLNLLLALSRRNGNRFVYVSSSEIYGSALSRRMNEAHPTRPHSTYAVSKLAADRMVFTFHKETGVPATVVRPFNSYGPRVTQPYIVPEIVTQALSASEFITLGNLKSTRDFTFVEDTAKAIVLAGSNDSAIGETINVGSGVETSIEDLAKLILEITGSRKEVKSEEIRMRPYDVERLICDNRKAKKLLGWSPNIPLKQGLKITIEWLRTHKVRFRGPFVRWYDLNTEDSN